jgi:hypothetical protein
LLNLNLLIVEGLSHFLLPMLIERLCKNFCLLNYLLLIGDKFLKETFNCNHLNSKTHYGNCPTHPHPPPPPFITIEYTVILEMLVLRYFEDFRLAFPDVQRKNKMHHMVHYMPKSLDPKIHQ